MTHSRPDELAALRQEVQALRDEIFARNEIERALRERERELNEFLESATECLHGVGPDGTILWANTAELQLLGYTREEYIGKQIAEVHADREVVEDMLARLLRGERLFEYEARLRTKDGGIKHVLINSSGLFKDGRFVHTRCFMRDITERKSAAEAYARLAAIVESSDDAIVGKTLEGVITSWNRGAERLFGYSAAEAVGRNITVVIPDDRLPEEADVLARLQRGEKIDHFETVRRTRDGRLLDISLTVSPIRDAAGRIIGASKVARDITERKRAETERQRLLQRAEDARAEAERALQVRDEFFAAVSHELRTPLNAIVGWAHLLRTGELDAEAGRRAAEIIHRNGIVQNQLIADLLDVQRLTSGRLRLNMRDDVDLAFAIEAAIDTVRPAAHAKAITVTAVLDDSPPVAGDPERIQQIAWNLLSNAVKFTPHGGAVDVLVRTAESHVEMVVQDNGPGIKPEFLPYVFERFRQDPSSGARRIGLGLGLTIVRNLVELHGGTIEAANRPTGTGAVFTVCLPRLPVAGRVEALTATAAAAAGVHRASSGPFAALHGTKVLLVDDDRDAREDLAVLLGHCGADVIVATSAEDALPLVTRERPDVLLCDINMPGEDGYAFLQRVRALPEQAGGLTPAAAFTGFTTAADRRRAVEAGFHIHIPKPVQPAELASAIAALVRARTR